MMSYVPDPGDETDDLLRQAHQGDRHALGELLSRHRDRLRLMVGLRIDRRLRGRIDPSDVLQEAYVEATERFADYLRDRDMPFFLWLRFLTAQKLLALHRHHLGTQARDAARDVSLGGGGSPEADSAALAAQLVGRHTSPSQAAVRAELQARMQQALNGMDPIDREVLALRHFEQLTNAETARVLGIHFAAASIRYVWPAVSRPQRARNGEQIQSDSRPGIALTLLLRSVGWGLAWPFRLLALSSVGSPRPQSDD